MGEYHYQCDSCNEICSEYYMSYREICGCHLCYGCYTEDDSADDDDDAEKNDKNIIGEKECPSCRKHRQISELRTKLDQMVDEQFKVDYKKKKFEELLKQYIELIKN